MLEQRLQRHAISVNSFNLIGRLFLLLVIFTYQISWNKYVTFLKRKVTLKFFIQLKNLFSKDTICDKNSLTAG